MPIDFQPRIFSSLDPVGLTNYALNSLGSTAFESCEQLKILKLEEMIMEDETINGILAECSCWEKFSLIHSYDFEKLEFRNSILTFL